MIPKGLQIKKRPAFEAISDDFNIKWDKILHDAERNLVKLLLAESSKVVEKVELNIDQELKRVYPNSYEAERLQLNEKHQKFQKSLDKRRAKQWNNIKSKESMSSVKEVYVKNKREKIEIGGTEVYKNNETNVVRPIKDNIEKITETLASSTKEVSDKNITEKVKIEGKEVLESIELDVVDFVKNNLGNITDNRVYRKKKKMKFFSDVVKSEMPSTSTTEGEKNGKTVIDLRNIQSMLLRDEDLNSSRIQNSPPKICTDTSMSVNSSNNYEVSTNVEAEVFSTQDQEFLDILEEIQNPKATVCENGRLEGYFCSDTVFNLSNRFLILKLKCLRKDWILLQYSAR